MRESPGGAVDDVLMASRVGIDMARAAVAAASARHASLLAAGDLDGARAAYRDLRAAEEAEVLTTIRGTRDRWLRLAAEARDPTQAAGLHRAVVAVEAALGAGVALDCIAALVRAAPRALAHGSEWSWGREADCECPVVSVLRGPANSTSSIPTATGKTGRGRVGHPGRASSCESFP